MKYISVVETAKMLGKSRQWIWSLIKMNRLEAFRIGKQFAISEDEIKRYKSESKRDDLTNVNETINKHEGNNHE